MNSFRRNPWLIAGMGLVLLMVTNGLTATAVSVFDESLLGEFGWSRGDLKFRDFLSFGIVALLAPVSGWLLDRVGARRLLIAGLAVLAVAYLAFGRIESLWQMYAIYVLFAFALLTSGTMVVIVLVSSWFVARRGQAVGIALVGTSLGTFLFSPLNVALIEVLGWRRAFAFEALIPLTALLLVILFVRNSPTEFGGRPLGVLDGAIDPRSVGLSFAEAFRTRTFWAISLSGFLTYYSILALFNHLYLHMRGLGFEPATAGKALSLLALLAMIGKLGSGWLADRLDRHRVFMANITLMFIGVAGLATLRGGWFVWACVTLIGLGWGGLFTLYNMLTVNNFGLREIGRINGAVSTLESFGGGLGIWLTGRLYDQYQSYGVPFTVLAACVFTGLVIGAFIRNELQRRQVMVA